MKVTWSEEREGERLPGFVIFELRLPLDDPMELGIKPQMRVTAPTEREDCEWLPVLVMMVDLLSMAMHFVRDQSRGFRAAAAKLVEIVDAEKENGEPSEPPADPTEPDLPDLGDLPEPEGDAE